MVKLIKSLWAPRFLFVIALTYTLAITFGSLMSTEEIPKVGFELSDKVIHFIAYGFLLFFWFLFALITFKHNSYIKILIAASLFSIIYGIIIEVLQGVLVLTREADFQDVIANFAGISFTFLLLVLLRNKILTLKSTN